MGSHYPLNGIDLDFRRYAHRSLGGRDVIINRVMEDLMHPRRVLPKTYLKTVRYPHNVGPIKSEDRELGLDMQIMWRLLTMEWPHDMEITLQQKIIELVQLHYLECDPLLHQVINSFSWRDRNAKTAPRWKRDMVARLACFEEPRRVQHRFSVFSRSSQLPYNRGPENGILSLGDCFAAAPWKDGGPVWPAPLRREGKRSGYLTMPSPNTVRHVLPKRARSLPAEGRWGIVTSSPMYDPRWEGYVPYVVFYPLRSLPELDKLSRRRSLSRSHIRAMFMDKPEWLVESAVPSADPRARPKNPCTNCAQYTHKTEACPSKCGYCDSPKHKARNCTLKPSNRCKCRPFPQFHRASQCQAKCSRRCGSPYPPGAFRHLNAMGCARRCCMCGAEGHSGAKCSLKRCPCGEQHLTQDCRWKVECAAPGCRYYLCRVHCRECARKKGKGPEDSFVGRTCQACLKNGVPVSARAP